MGNLMRQGGDFTAAYARLINNFGRDYKFRRITAKALVQRTQDGKRLDFAESFPIVRGDVITCVSTEEHFKVVSKPVVVFQNGKIHHFEVMISAFPQGVTRRSA